MKIKLFYILLTITILFGSCKKNNSKLVNMSDDEFIEFISNDNDFKNGISKIDSLLNTKSFSNNKTALLYYEKAMLYYASEAAVSALGNFNIALEYFAKENNNNRYIGKTHLAISDLYLYLKKTEESITHRNLALKIIKKHGTKNEKADVFGVIANSEYVLKNYKKALNYYFKSSKILIEINDNTTLSSCYYGMGMTYYRMNDFEKFIQYIEKSIQVELDNGIIQTSGSQCNLGYFYYKRKEFLKAEQYYLEAIEIEKKRIDNHQQLLKIYKKLKLIFTKQNKLKEVSKYKNLIDSISKEVVENKNKEKLKLIENQFKLKTNETNLKRQKTLKKNFVIGFLIILIPIIGLLYMYYQKIQSQIKLNKVQEEISHKEIESLQKDQELNLIKASIKGQDKARERIAQELHDSIGGNLAGIKLQLSNISKDDEEYKTIAKQIDDTYEQVRDISHNLIPQKFDEKIFTTLIESYIGNIQKGSKIKITFSPHPKEEINAINKNLKVTLFNIIQELITNVIKHAEATEIDIHISKFEQTIKLLFEDNGKGFDPKAVKNGIGFANIKSRLNKVSGLLRIDSFKDRGTIFDIDMPVNATNKK